MGRHAKPLTEYFRSMVTAAHLADCLGVARAGFALARWFEKDQHLPKGSADEKAWRRFLNGHQPHQSRLDKIFHAVPSVRAFYEHPVWQAAGLSCTDSQSLCILKSFGWDGTRYGGKWFKGIYSLSALDQLACLLAMLGCSSRPTYCAEIARRLCVAYIEISTEEPWQSFANDLWLIINVKLAHSSEVTRRLTEPEVTYERKFWTLVKNDFFAHEASASFEGWCAWREAVLALGWLDRERLVTYIDGRKDAAPSACNVLALRVYKKVRAKMYRALN
ncbi:hypothetical protein [Pseudomonas moorei]|uniref:Uncharacterized protein n=1 Tax=Pseudomonas moorei TaxID=395599 RepID=A0A1H1F3U3_9PSED|nr:hypothetical protein [Pseudomonas moorei]KAB0509890.1 hypothetical protein F7R06_02355 [Pseudomonas moorei]SDQ95655.1 hypothetical protein SAMN04490195_2500 [Pseudomonas moorei]